MGIRNNTLPSPSSGPAEGKSDAELLRLWVQSNQAVLEVLLDAFCVVDMQNKVVDFNVAFTELCGESYRKILKVGDFCTLIRTEHCPDQCPAKQVVQTKKTIRLDELGGSSKAYPALQMILGGVPIHTADGRIIGSLLTIRNVSAESELQKKYYERKQESVMDGLTQLYNKVYSEAMLLKCIKGTLRDPQTLSVLLCDIDHFKKVNDTHGHQAGDFVLSNVAQIAKTVARDSDIVGRFGGEEFLVILTNTDRYGAGIFAERFRSRVEATPFSFQSKTIAVTISLGTATFAEKWREGMHPEDCLKELVSKADSALYFAKANGRNRFCQYEALPEQASQTIQKEKKAKGQ